MLHAPDKQGRGFHLSGKKSESYRGELSVESPVYWSDINHVKKPEIYSVRFFPDSDFFVSKFYEIILRLE